MGQSEQDGEGKEYFWRRESCWNFRHVICEFPLQHPRLTNNWQLEDEHGEELCWEEEDVEGAREWETKRQCVRLITLQYSRDAADNYCRAEFGQGLAKFDRTNQYRLLNLFSPHQFGPDKAESFFFFFKYKLLRTRTCVDYHDTPPPKKRFSGLKPEGIFPKNVSLTNN